MPDDRLDQLRVDHAADAYLGGEPPDLGPMRALAEHEELADAVSRVADGYGRPLPAEGPQPLHVIERTADVFPMILGVGR